MAQTNENNKSEEAEERTRGTKRFVRQVRSATRRKYSFEEKIRIVLEGFRRGVTVNELCRREGIKVESTLANGEPEAEKHEREGGNRPLDDIGQNGRNG